MNLIDMHCDTAGKILDSQNGENLRENPFSVNLEGMKKAGTMAQFFANFIYLKQFQGEDKYERLYERAMCMIRRIKEEVEACSKEMALALNAQDILHNKEAGKISAVLTLEEGGIINHDIHKLDELYREGIRLVTLMWNFENCMGFPNSTDAGIMQKGLKEFGFEVIERMNELGMLVDVAHMSDGGFWDAVRFSKAPVVASHSNARSLCAHPRNLTDEMLRALGEKGGVAGLNFYPRFVREDMIAMREDLARHIRHMVNMAGIDAVAVGTDFDGFDESDGTLEVNKSEKMEILCHQLQKDGFSEGQIDKIWSGNAMRVIEEVMR